MDLSFIPPAQRGMANEIIKQCVVDRTWFITEVLGVDHIEDWQKEVLNELDSGGTKISIRSGHGVGKTALCSWLGLHFVLFRDDVKVIITSPSFKQLTDGLIPEMNKWISRLPLWMADQLETTSERVTRKPNTKNNFVSFRTARKENPEALAGVHAENVLIIVDEASGVDEVVYETGQGALSTEGAIAVLIGNPTRPNGFFYKTHTTLKHLWWTKAVPCSESSRVSPDYIESQRLTYGADSREFKVRVLGEFPSSDADAIIPRKWVQAARVRSITTTSGSTVWGVDVGRGGDPSGFVERCGRRLTVLKELKYENTMNVTGWVKSRWDELRPNDRPAHIFVDSIGVGAGVADRLLELGLPVIGVNVAESAALKERYHNLRAELWFECRSWFEKQDCCIVDGPETVEHIGTLEEELSAVQYKFTSLGKTQVESKDDMKRRGVPSPNLADALCLTFAMGGAVLNGNFDLGWWNTKVDTLSYKPANVY